MSRRKVKGLTQTGRQVSEDPDLDNLLSTLSPEEILELNKDLKNVPDVNLEDGKIPVPGDCQAAQPHPSGDVRDGGGKLSQREKSSEVSEKLSIRASSVGEQDLISLNVYMNASMASCSHIASD